MTKLNFSDIHTHRLDAPADAVINLEPDMVPVAGHVYSVGVHPWHTGRSDVDALWHRVENLAANSQVVMIGECGIDKKRGADLGAQTDMLRRHAVLAETVGKPLLLHVVGAFPEVIKLRRDLQPRQPWIVHGFRGKPQLADELLRHGFSLSLGEKFNPHTARIIPDSRLYAETDTSTCPISQIRAMIAEAKLP